MDYINFIPPSDYYIVDDESEEQMEDVAYQYGDIEKIIDFDSVTEIPKVNSTMEIDTLTENLKTVSIDDGKRKYKKYMSEQVLSLDASRILEQSIFSKVEPLTKADAEKLEQEYANSVTKKRKAKYPEKKNPLKKGTTAYHIVKFMEVVMDTLDRHVKKEFFIVMDNCRIHHSSFVIDAIYKRG
ncbi:hypothetical protein HPULCUR_003923 [Helicostylum pulchrum]|uniref:Tc1-like transposase DDE domain-containing protein n=1 Tax=Helicostylum pulchrum TaxID=562976 RepID=A0ABP9XUS1_9FUNG